MSYTSLKCVYDSFILQLPGKGVVRDVLSSFAPGQTLATDLEKIIAQDEYYRLSLQKVAAKLRKETHWQTYVPPKTDDELPTLVRAIQRIGVRETRNIVAALWLLKLANPTAQEQMITSTYRDILKHSLALEDYFETQRMGHLQEGFCGGFLYDWATRLTRTSKGMGITSKNLERLESYWKRGFRVASIAYTLGAPLKGFGFQKFIFTCSLCLSLGRFFLSLYRREAWTKIDDSRRKHSHLATQLRELKHLQMSYNQVASSICAFFAPIRECESAVYHVHQPFFLRSQHPDLFRLSVLLSIAELFFDSFIASEFSSAENLPLHAHHDAWLSEIGQTRKGVLEAFYQSFQN